MEEYDSDVNLNNKNAIKNPKVKELQEFLQDPKNYSTDDDKEVCEAIREIASPILANLLEHRAALRTQARLITKMYKKYIYKVSEIKEDIAEDCSKFIKDYYGRMEHCEDDVVSNYDIFKEAIIMYLNIMGLPVTHIMYDLLNYEGWIMNDLNDTRLFPAKDINPKCLEMYVIYIINSMEILFIDGIK